jgi:hypothetical protein
MGIVIKKFNKNNTPQSQIEESYNYNESLNVGNANGVRQDIIIKRDLSEDELEKEIISYMKSKGKILERKDIDYLLSRYFEVKDRNMWQAIVSFFSDMFNSIKALKHADYGDIEKPEEYAVIIDTAMHRFLGANMYPFLKSLITFFTIYGLMYLVGMVLIMINVWLFLFLVGPLALIEITQQTSNNIILVFFKFLNKEIILAACSDNGDVNFTISGTLIGKDAELISFDILMKDGNIQINCDDSGVYEIVSKIIAGCMDKNSYVSLKEIVEGGWYRHYKGGIYQILCVATHTESGEEQVIYKGKTKGRIWARPKTMFMDGRFQPIGQKEG